MATKKRATGDFGDRSMNQWTTGPQCVGVSNVMYSSPNDMTCAQILYRIWTCELGQDSGTAASPMKLTSADITLYSTYSAVLYVISRTLVVW